MTSNYVYHNITGKDKSRRFCWKRCARAEKRAGHFAIHDLMSLADTAICRVCPKRRDMGYERVELIDTTRRRLYDAEGSRTPDALRLNIAGGKKVIGAAAS